MMKRHNVSSNVCMYKYMCNMYDVIMMLFVCIAMCIIVVAVYNIVCTFVCEVFVLRCVVS